MKKFNEQTTFGEICMCNHDCKTVAIILLNYNSYDYTKACMESLQKMTYTDFGIIIVDNCSTDDSLEKLQKFESEQVHIINSPRNGGFAFGNNLGIKYAIDNGYSYFLLLNNDTLVEQNFLDVLIETAVKEDSDISTCRILYNSNRNVIWYAGGEIDLFNQRAKHMGMNTLYQSSQDDLTSTVSFISGCCMLISRQCINKIGLLPEEYFMYYEDVDYCQNAINNNLKLVYTPNTSIYHCVSASGGGESSPFVIEWKNRSRRKFISKYKNQLTFKERVFGSVICELREMIRVIISHERMSGIKAYTKSFM